MKKARSSTCRASHRLCHQPPGVTQCEARSPAGIKITYGSSSEGFICTRRKGHKGKHVACSTHTHNIVKWK